MTSPPAALERFLGANFPGLTVRAPLFYSWPIGIRFELGGDLPDRDERLAQADARAIAIYEASFHEDDTGWAIAYSWPNEHANDAVFRRVIDGADVTIDEGIDLYDEGDDSPYRRAVSRARPRAVDYVLATRSINERRGANNDDKLWWSLFVVDEPRPLILHHYDDRGLDIVASDIETLAPLYRRFDGWILDYDRPRVDATFASVRP